MDHIYTMKSNYRQLSYTLYFIRISSRRQPLDHNTIEYRSRIKPFSPSHLLCHSIIANLCFPLNPVLVPSPLILWQTNEGPLGPSSLLSHSSNTQLLFHLVVSFSYTPLIPYECRNLMIPVLNQCNEEASTGLHDWDSIDSPSSAWRNIWYVQNILPLWTLVQCSSMGKISPLH